VEITGDAVFGVRILESDLPVCIGIGCGPGGGCGGGLPEPTGDCDLLVDRDLSDASGMRRGGIGGCGGLGGGCPRSVDIGVGLLVLPVVVDILSLASDID